MHNVYRYFGRSILVCSAVFVAACSPLQPVDLPPEYTSAPAAAELWTTLASERPGEWYALLNDGPSALDWRLRAIDSATESIDLQTFIWDLDGSGELIRQRLLAAAERGVFVRVLVDGQRDAGNHRVTWDGRDKNGGLVGSGSYFARLQIAGPSRSTTYVQRLTLLK